MLELQLFRTDKGGDPEKVRESQRRRFKDVGLVDKVIELDEAHLKVRKEADNLRKDMNEKSKMVGKLKKEKKDDEAQVIMDQVPAIKNEIKDKEEEAKRLITMRDETIRMIGNLVPDSVPVSQDENENKVERTWGEPGAAAGDGLNHVDLLHRIGGVEYERGVTAAGSRGYFLVGDGVLLNLALIHYGVHFLTTRGHIAVQPPYFMERDAMAKCAQLDDFDEQLYKVSGDGGDKYLIATSEQPLCVYHMDEWIAVQSLPLKYVGVSTCFRKETGSHGRDTLGIFRVHQFEKLEQFVVCSPEGDESWTIMDEMLGNAEEFYQALGIPYRVVNIVSGALNNAAAKKYDLEGWFPASTTYRELVSCSNCTDYQARRLEVRYGQTKKQGDARESKFVHMLNSTLCATTRVICAILENYQTSEGVRVPEVLQPYMGGKSFLPFVRDAPLPPKPLRK
ncbi:Serine--tRNA ligase, cytoplasmic [Porphyridium purpureum]|uniref:serine--tRNA ligase n=1 Tax=Porphyridium purpureum TaxID=35688 RepID=A0A5J4YVX6_PORPP|nr:Serine--tRNA ligase, cytoplasmic [Porphyridium purpureum]|eukprot:POR3601..scf209_3